MGVSNNSGPSFNSDQFKAQQRQMWDNAAAGWQTWWETIERGAQKVSDKIVELADVNLLQTFHHKCWKLQEQEPSPLV
jgi:hypothetical protein